MRNPMRGPSRPAASDQHERQSYPARTMPGSPRKVGRWTLAGGLLLAAVGGFLAMHTDGQPLSDIKAIGILSLGLVAAVAGMLVCNPAVVGRRRLAPTSSRSGRIWPALSTN